MQAAVKHARGRRWTERLLPMGVALVVSAAWSMPALAASASAAAIMGVVRDAQGVGQMGALVQVLADDSATVGTAFTDLHGHYLIRNILPGKYQVRASATLFVPATKGNLELRTGTRAVVNLTLAALFDTTQWLPAERRRTDEPADDWRWTLRSSANRPILRVLDDGSIEVAGSVELPRTGMPLPTLTVLGGDGGFGAGGVQTALSMSRANRSGSEFLMRANVGVPVGGDGGATPVDVAAGYEKGIGFGGTARTMVSVRSHPELIAPDGGRGMQVLEVTGAQATSIGDLVDVEFGGSMRAVHTAAAEGFASAPFLRVTAHPGGTWTIRYQLAAARDLQGVDDLTPQGELPVAAVSDGHLVLENGRHQQLAVTHKLGAGVIEVAVFHDSLDNVGVEGVGFGLAKGSAAGMLVDPTTGSFRTLNAGYVGNGAELLVSSPLPTGMRATLQYNLGTAMGTGDSGTSAARGVVPGLHAYGTQAATAAIKGRVRATGTAVRAVYRWQPSKMVTAVNPYGAFSDQGFLSFSVKQSLRCGSHLPPGLNATIDVTNLLEQGYRPFFSADGHTLYFAQAPRTMQAGLSFSF